ncbi:MAG: alkaline phosphatase family protein [Candidatus Hydrothermales bacterium]
MKLFVFGLDGVPFNFVDEKLKDKIPNIKNLIDESQYGILKSIIPPITVPAWICMLSGKTPGELGIYGFRNRKSDDYKLKVLSSYDVKEDTVLEFLSKKGKKVVSIGIPPSYPPRPINGIRISCFLTPEKESKYSYPEEISGIIEENFGKYIFDVRGFRTEKKEWLKEEIFKMTEQHFEIVKYLVKNINYDLFFFVEMGPDRIHHGFWRFFDKTHNLYEKNNLYEEVIPEYYSFLDKKIGEVLEILPEETWIMIVSDHGAKKIEGCVAVNELLIKEGFLKLKENIKEQKRLEPEMIDFKKTLAYGEGGYYSRVYLNIKERDREGVIDKRDYERIRKELKEIFEGLKNEENKNIGTKAYYPEEIYPEVKGFPPDLIVIFGDLDYRSVGSVGIGKIFTLENDTGPDDANHSYEGIYIIRAPDKKLKGRKDGSIYDITNTIMKIFEFDEIEISPLRGKSLI